MVLENFIPYRFMSGKRMEDALGVVPHTALRITRDYYIIRKDDATRIYDHENLFPAFVRAALKEAERAAERTNYCM